jgi:hypothetical protein
MNRFSHFPNFNEKATIVIGKPMEASEYDGGNSVTRYQTAAERIMAKIGSLEIPKQNIL